ncbi:hypothetical protein [Microvirga roseola]|uniref:hypothetical protein n=1 Tax=Microvirga roseola TaxID=2883126 RepID=UPI001E2FE002|nr:hypothetical protein [Microvirga roseola]
MRRLLFGVLGFATLGLGALSAQPTEAHQSYRTGYGYSAPVVQHVQYHRPYRGYRPHRAYRPYRPFRTVQRCWIQPQRIWNGYRWVRRPVEVCRTVRRPVYRF